MPVLEVRNLRVQYFTHRGIVDAVDDVSFQIDESAFMGLAGESGCGKSTLAYSILGLTPPPGKIVGGHIWFRRKDFTTMDETSLSKVRWTEISMIFQQSMDAMNPVMRIGDQIAESITIHRKEVPKQEALQQARELFKLVGLDMNRINDYPFELSGGMKQRAIIAMALSCNPDLVIADEPTTALDVSIQAQIIDLLRSLKTKLNMSLLLISHDLSVLAEVCNRVAIMYAGKIVEDSDVVSIFKQPLHPYTKGLIMSIPSMEKSESKTLFSIPGKPPDLLNPSPACRFQDRCPYVHQICKERYPNPVDYEGVACHFVDEMKGMTGEQLWGDRIGKLA
jgi:peptide/nickel transport system ATP-binding protein